MKEIWNDSYRIEANKYMYNTHVRINKKKKIFLKKDKIVAT